MRKKRMPKKSTFAMRATSLLVGSLLMCCAPARAQTCSASTVLLATQAEVDAFDCVEVTGNLLISGDDISDLSPLLGLTTVGEEFAVRDNGALASLTGLESLESVGRLTVAQNDLLSSLEGLDGLASVGTSLFQIMQP